MSVYFIKFGTDKGHLTFTLTGTPYNGENLMEFSNGCGYRSQVERRDNALTPEQRWGLYTEDGCDIDWFALACAVWSECADEICKSAQTWLKWNGYAPADAIIPMLKRRDLN